MTRGNFKDYVYKRMEEIKFLLVKKQKEYARCTDVFHNFRRAGKIRRKTPEGSLQGMMDKHIVAVLDIVDSIELRCYNNLTIEHVKEKIGDNIAYLFLLEAMILERLENERIDCEKRVCVGPPPSKEFLDDAEDSGHIEEIPEDPYWIMPGRISFDDDHIGHA